eukprot:2661222-Rhodomonas_salina.3
MSKSGEKFSTYNHGGALLASVVAVDINGPWSLASHLRSSPSEIWRKAFRSSGRIHGEFDCTKQGGISIDVIG